MKIHIVQKGDTLWTIAKKYNVNFEELKKLNSQLSNPELIMPGMKIKIPVQKQVIKQESPKISLQSNKKEKEMIIGTHDSFHSLTAKEKIVEKKETIIPEHKPMPKPEHKPMPKPEHKPAPKPEHKPMPKPEHKPAPKPEHKPTPIPVPIPIPVPVPVPKPTPTPKPVPVPKKEIKEEVKVEIKEEVKVKPVLPYVPKMQQEKVKPIVQVTEVEEIMIEEQDNCISIEPTCDIPICDTVITDQVIMDMNYPNWLVSPHQVQQVMLQPECESCEVEKVEESMKEQKMIYHTPNMNVTMNHQQMGMSVGSYSNENMCEKEEQTMMQSWNTGYTPNHMMSQSTMHHTENNNNYHMMQQQENHLKNPSKECDCKKESVEANYAMPYMPMHQMQNQGQPYMPMHQMQNQGQLVSPMHQMQNQGQPMMPMHQMQNQGQPMMPMHQMQNQGQLVMPMHQMQNQGQLVTPMHQMQNQGQPMMPMHQMQGQGQPMMPMHQMQEHMMKPSMPQSAGPIQPSMNHMSYEPLVYPKNFDGQPNFMLKEETFEMMNQSFRDQSAIPQMAPFGYMNEEYRSSQNQQSLSNDYNQSSHLQTINPFNNSPDGRK